MATTYRPSPGIPGIYHKVERGQTLWRISRLYNIDIDELVSINRISDAASIEVGQLIFIPRPESEKQQVIIEKNGFEDFIWPCRGKVISSFGQLYNNMLNKGINIQPYAETEILASRSGRVVFYSPQLTGYGKTIIIDHGDGFSTVYARSSEVLIKLGERVQKGSLIAKINPHKARNAYLHFEIRKGSVSQNPYFYLSR